MNCVSCIDNLTAFQLDLLAETDASVVGEHVESCPDCRVFSSQLDETARVLQTVPMPELSSQVAEAISDSDKAIEAGDTDMVLRQLCHLADSLDPDNAEDLVQSTFLRAAELGGSLTLADLARDLADTVLADDQPDLRGLHDFGVAARTALDGDGDEAELYYPEFYDDGPDIGRFIEAPSEWGRVNTLTPEQDLATTELFGTVDDALAQLPDPQRQLVQLVDIDQLSVGDAAAALRLSADDAIAALHKGRVHVRGALAEYAN